MSGLQPLFKKYNLSSPPHLPQPIQGRLALHLGVLPAVVIWLACLSLACGASALVLERGSLSTIVVWLIGFRGADHPAAAVLVYRPHPAVVVGFTCFCRADDSATAVFDHTLLPAVIIGLLGDDLPCLTTATVFNY